MIEPDFKPNCPEEQPISLISTQVLAQAENEVREHLDNSGQFQIQNGPERPASPEPNSG